MAIGDNENYIDSDLSNSGDFTITKNEIVVSTDGSGDYTSLDDALESINDNVTIILKKGTYDLTKVIKKNVVIKGEGKYESIINVKKDVAGNLNASKIEFDSVGIIGSGSSAVSGGVYFQNGAKLTNFTVKNSHISNMNTFIKFVNASSNAIDINITNCEIDSMGQFFMWVTKTINKITVDGNVIENSNNGAVSNPNAALFRIRCGEAYIYNNTFINDVIAIDGLFECGVSGKLVEVKYNTFKNVTKYVHINDGKPVNFDKNLYLDKDNKVLTSVPSQIKGNGVVSGTLVSSEDERLKAYIGTSSTKFEIIYDLRDGKFEETVNTIYDSLTGLDTLPTPMKDGYAFTGWLLDDKVVTSLPKGIDHDITLVAQYTKIEGGTYMITYHTEKGEWPTRSANGREEIISELFSDMYKWGKTNGFTGTYEAYENDIRTKLSSYQDINIRNTNLGNKACEDGSTKHFLNIPEYFEKWSEFFAIFDKAMLNVNGEQSFYKDTYATMIRLNQFIASNYETGTGKKYFGSYMNQMCAVVKILAEIPTTYESGQKVVLPVLTSKTGTKFLGWYDNKEFNGNPITEIKPIDKGNKELFAKWEEEIKVDSFEINLINEIARYDTHQLVWTLYPLNASNKNVEFSSSDESVATITSKTGLITALKDGTTNITMKVFGNPDLTYTWELVVSTPHYVTGEFVENSWVMENEYLEIKAIINDPLAELIWSSSDESIALVDDGVVSAIKPGTVVIKATSSQEDNLYLEFKVTVLSNEEADIIKYIAKSNNANIFTDYGLLIGGTYTADIYGSVSKLLNEKYEINDKYYAIQQEKDSNGKFVKTNFGPVKDSIEFITVHYTGNMAKGANANANASYFSNGGNGTSIHYVTGNDGIYSSLDEKYVGFHAGDSTDVKFEWFATGVKHKDSDPLYPVWGISSDSYFTINGEKTSIKTPYDNGYTKNGKVLHKGNGQVTDSKWINDMGLPFKVVDGQYYMGTTWWCHTQILEGRICSKGGNNNSIGIESCVNEGSDLWYTWQKTARLVADIMVRNNLDITRVVGHHFFSAKNCPQPMLENNLRIWNEFIKLVEAEYERITTFKDYEITFKSNNPDIIDDRGRVIAVPDVTTCVTYTVTCKKGSEVKQITLSSIVPGKFEK